MSVPKEVCINLIECDGEWLAFAHSGKATDDNNIYWDSIFSKYKKVTLKHLKKDFLKK